MDLPGSGLTLAGKMNPVPVSSLKREQCANRNTSIDKTNSVELSEAINSMYEVSTCTSVKPLRSQVSTNIAQWYRNAHVCYAYLADVPKKWAVLDFFGRTSHFDRHGSFKKKQVVYAGLDFTGAHSPRGCRILRGRLVPHRHKIGFAV